MLNSDLALGTTLVYDTHGNTIRLADQTMTYDIADRHMSTTLDDGTTIVYVRDATARIVSRTTDTPTEAPVTIRYTSGGAMTAVLDTGGAVLQRSIPLPGGVQVTITGTTELWSYPNMHGDVILSADAVGNRSTMATATRTDAPARFSYDPFGQPIHPVTGAIGTSAADEAIPNNLVGDADFAFVGQHQKLYEHQGSVATIEMGVRMYVAALGRFLSVDPVEGGVTNSYDYPADPINGFDLSGMMTADSAEHYAAQGYGLKIVSGTIQATSKDGARSRAPSRRSGCDYVPVIHCGFVPISYPNPDVSYHFCVHVCFDAGVVWLGDGKAHGYVGASAGKGIGATLNIGGSLGKAPGWSVGTSCGVATPYGGGYVEAGFDPANVESRYLGSGLSFGAAAGCNFGGSYTF